MKSTNNIEASEPLKFETATADVDVTVVAV